jgi:hypothetical protein
MNLFPIFFTNSGSAAIRRKDLRQAQLRVVYSLLYCTRLWINEIRQIIHKKILDAITFSQLNVIHQKIKQAHIHVLLKNGVKKLKELSLEYTIIFNKSDYKYLFRNNKPIYQKALSRFINNDLKNTCQVFGIPYNIKSHSFRINMISNLLKTTTA